MERIRWTVLLLALPTACGDDTRAGQPWAAGTEGTSSAVDDTSDGQSGPDSTTNPSDSNESLDPDSSGAIDPSLDTMDTEDIETGDSAESESDTDSGGFDCTPWDATWIGAPCAEDGDCGFDGGSCIREDEGFPCGTCSQPCDALCPDLDGTPSTFCVDGGDVGLDASGYCLSQCDPGLLGGNGCRDGYACTALDRFNDPGASAGVCVPVPFTGEGDTPCQQALLELGAVFTPVDHTPESPDGFPSLTCDIDEPVFLYSPVNGVGLRYVESADDSEVFVSCDTALSIVGSAAVAQTLGADEIIHIGTYNCRVISGTSNLSQHGHANAIDIYGFTMEDGSEHTLIDDWEHDNDNPSSTGGQMLKDFADQSWGMMLWNIILTPDFNAAHDNHFHVDRTPGGNSYN